MYKLIVLVFGVSLFAACASKPVKFITQPIVDKKAVVYIYRPLVLANALVSPKVMLNGNVLFEIENGSYQHHTVEVGKQVFAINPGERYLGNKSIALDVAPESRYFLRVTSSTKFEMNKPYTRSFYLQQVEASTALLELASIPAVSSVGQPKEVIPSTNAESEEAEFSINKSRNPFAK